MLKGNTPVSMIKLENSSTRSSVWKRNTQFGMKYLNVFYTIISVRADVAGTDVEDKWIEDEDFSRYYLLNCLSNRLAEMCIKITTAKEIWDALEEQFKEEESMSKTHLVDKFMTFTFTEDREILPQVADFENLVDKLNSENIPLSDGFVGGAIIFKLPSAWYSFKTEMYQKKTQIIWRLEE